MNNFFESQNLDSNFVRALKDENIVIPTPIQEGVIPYALQGMDVVGQAPTGTGKTLAFVLPALERLDRDDNSAQVLVLCPTRELVIQICEVISKVLKYSEKIRVAGLYGGQNIQRQLMFLRKKPQFIVGTVGRVLDHMERKTLKLNTLKTFVLDEGDEMFDMGFRNDIERIMTKCPKDCQKMVFSATIPKDIQALIDSKLNQPKRIKTTIEGENTPKIDQQYFVLKDSNRIGLLLRLIDEHDYDRVMVFCNTKKRADKVAQLLISKNRSAMVLHGDLRQTERTRIMKKFKSGELQILIATDVAARGIDVNDVQAVVNFDPPTTEDFYVHRIGRTARANKGGVAYTFIDGDQTANIPIYQKITGNALQYVELPEIADSFTLPKDSSNRLNRASVEENTSRFFVNVGKKDMLDKNSVLKIITLKTNIKVYEVTEIKLRDTYGFVEVVKGKESELKKLEGLMIGTRKLTIEDADQEKMKKPAENKEYKPKKEKTDIRFMKKGLKENSKGEKGGRKGGSEKSRKSYKSKPDGKERKENHPRATKDDNRKTKQYGGRPTQTKSSRPTSSPKSKGSKSSSKSKSKSYK